MDYLKHPFSSKRNTLYEKIGMPATSQPLAPIDMPRRQWVGSKRIHMEPGFPHYLVQALQRKGHEIEEMADGGTESRMDGAVATW